MIPKIIHYCWFGKGLMQKSQKDCIKNWKKLMPDYQFMQWDESNFDVEKYDYTQAAYSAKKYAYVSDVARCEALLKHGGIYMDTDVEVFKRLDSYLNHGLFSAIEMYKEFEDVKNQYVDEEGNPFDKCQGVPWCGILSSIIGCDINNVLIGDCLNYYKDWSVDKDTFVTIDGLLARLAVPYGFVYKDVIQHLNYDMVIYPTGIFGFAFSPNPNYTVSYHHNAASWQPQTRVQRRMVLFDKLGLLNLYESLRVFKKRLCK